MKVVIDIPETYYELCRVCAGINSATADQQIIANGMPYEERPQGEWNYIQAGMCVCPFCGAMPHKLYKNYCANCGAELKGGAKNE